MTENLLPQGPHRGPPPKVLLRAFPTDIPGDFDGPTIIHGEGLTKFGEDLVKTAKNTRKAIHELPDYMQRLLSMKGTKFEIAAMPDQLGRTRGSAAYIPTRNSIVLPLMYELIGMIDKSKQPVIHESRHAVDEFLGAIYGKNYTDISEHPVFAKAYEQDLKKISYQEEWTMNLEHFLPAGKPEQGGKAGNGEDPRFDNFFPRREVFAESGEWIIAGEFPGDDIHNGEYGPKFREMFAGSIQVSTKFHHDLDRLSQDNPDNEQFKKALKGYMDRMPDTPDAYLKTDMFAPPKQTAQLKPAAPHTPS